MTGSLKRRTVLAMSSAMAVYFASPTIVHAADSDQDDDSGGFVGLSKAYFALIRAVNPIADGITVRKFSWFLSSMIGPLAEISAAKQTVLSGLDSNACGVDSAQWIELSHHAAQKIPPLVDQLSNLTRRLSTAIKPGEVRQLSLQAEDDLRKLVAGKLWIESIIRYCAMPAAKKSIFRANVKRSLAAVNQSREDLERLLEALSNL